MSYSIEQLENAIEPYRRDALRYRWLLENRHIAATLFDYSNDPADRFNSAIDELMEKK